MLNWAWRQNKYQLNHIEEKTVNPPQSVPFNRALLHPRYWGKWCVVACLSFIGLLPYRLLDALGTAIGGLGYRFHRQYRRVARMNIDWCFPELSATERDRLLQAHFVAAARCVLMQSVLWWGNREKLVANMAFENREVLDAAVAIGTGDCALLPQLDVGFWRRWNCLALLGGFDVSPF